MGMMRDEIVELSRLITEKNLSKILVMGVQSLLTSVKEIKTDFMNFNIPFNEQALLELKNSRTVNALDVFRVLDGVKEVDALDCSDYEGANIIFNLNEDKNSIVSEYDLVIDGGTLEHIYNVANAMNNMNICLREGGYIYHLVPCAGWVNHGFYSFSPTFFTDAYGPKSGFKLEYCKLLFKQPKGQKDRLVFSQDTRMLGAEAINKLIADYSSTGGVLLKCIAKKISAVDCYTPEQSMYKNALWLNRFDEQKVLNGIVEKIKEFSSGVYLYGTGNWFQKIFEELIKNDLGKLVEGTFDSDIKKAEGRERGISILYPTESSISKAKAIIVSTVDFEKEVRKTLEMLGCKCDIIGVSDFL